MHAFHNLASVIPTFHFFEFQRLVVWKHFTISYERIYPTSNICKPQVKTGDSNLTKLIMLQIILETKKDEMGHSTSSSTNSAATSNDDSSKCSLQLVIQSQLQELAFSFNNVYMIPVFLNKNSFIAM